MKKGHFSTTLILCLMIAGAVCVNPLFDKGAMAACEVTNFKTCPSTPIGSSDVLVPGCVYRWADANPTLNALSDTIYLAGNLPILITVPHGGSIYATVPSSDPRYLPDRSSFCGANTATDAYTVELALAIKNEIQAVLGGYPHMIVNRLPRKKIDQNRALTEECNPSARPRGAKAWNDFHMNLKGKAVDTIMAQYGKGLYIDLHGKPDNYGADVHIGYHLTSTDLIYNSDTNLSKESKRFINDSSIGFLYWNLKQSRPDLQFAQLLRGDRSFGTILNKHVQAISTSYTVAPRTDAKSPYPYLSGEYNLLHFCGPTQGSKDYNTAAYGNDYDGTYFMSGIQLETCLKLRQQYMQEYAHMVALAIRDYLNMNYGFDF